MIQINLIPDVKKEYLRAQRTRNITISISIIVGLAAIGLVALLGVILGGQYVVDMRAQNRIDEEYQKLASVEDLPDILTIQNQLTKLPDQHVNSTQDSRLFTVINAVNPAAPNDVTFSSVELDPENSIVTLEGSATGGYPAVEALKKTIESTNFEYRTLDTDEVQTEPLAHNVGVADTTYGEDNTGAKVLRFTLSFEYAEGLFTNTVTDARIISPTQRVDVTDSRVRVPESLFQAAGETEEEQE